MVDKQITVKHDIDENLLDLLLRIDALDNDPLDELLKDLVCSLEELDENRHTSLRSVAEDARRPKTLNHATMVSLLETLRDNGVIEETQRNNNRPHFELSS